MPHAHSPARFAIALILVIGLSSIQASGVDLEEGDVVFCDVGNRTILRYSPTAGTAEVIASATVGAGGPFYSNDVALGADDALYSRPGGSSLSLIRIDPRTGDRSTVEDALLPLAYLGALAHSPHTREIYASSRDTLIQVDIDGGPASVVNSSLGLMNGPGDGMVVGIDAFLLLAYQGIYSVPSAGGPSSLWGQTTRMTDIATDPGGTVYLLQSVAPSGIYTLEEGGGPEDLVEVTGPNRGSGPLLSGSEPNRWFPYGLMASADGTLYVTTWGNPGRLLRVDVATGDRELLLSIPNSLSPEVGFGNGFVMWPGDVPLDDDQDGIANGLDNCPSEPNPDQADFDGDGIGDLCNVDADGDEFGDELDNCPQVFNPQQEDFDGNGVGDACNGFEDLDGDEIADGLDNCPSAFNPQQEDFDGNGVGDLCNDFEDRDGDDIADHLDNCPDDYDPTQSDSDGDGVEDACDPFPDEPDNEKGQCFVDLDEWMALALLVDEDQDGEVDATDGCPGTPEGEEVDQSGCSLTQFCDSFAVATRAERKACRLADWKNDEPLLGRGVLDCAIEKHREGWEDDRCVPGR